MGTAIFHVRGWRASGEQVTFETQGKRSAEWEAYVERLDAMVRG